MVEPNTATDIAIERVSLIFMPFGMKNILNPIHFLQKVKIKREPAPYGKCFRTWEETGMNEHAFEVKHGVILPYTQGVLKYISDINDINSRSNLIV